MVIVLAKVRSFTHICTMTYFYKNIGEPFEHTAPHQTYDNKKMKCSNGFMAEAYRLSQSKQKTIEKESSVMANVTIEVHEFCH